MSAPRAAALLLAAAAAVAGPAGAGAGAGAGATPLAIATGGVTGVYYQFGAAVCRLLADHPPAEPIDCTVEGTPGAVHNLIQLRAGAVRFATVQADSLYLAARGEGPFAAAGPDRKVRALFTFATETLNLLVRPERPAAGVAGLRGRRVNIGAPTSGTAVTFRRLMADRGWGEDDFQGLADYRSTLQSRALCQGRVDAVAFVGANPSGVVQDATFACGARLVPVEPELARSLLARYPFFVPATIPGGLYPANPAPTPTVGMRATLVASADASEALVRAATAAVLDHLDELRTLHLAFKDVRMEEITGACVFAPLHPGAGRYLRERGLRIEVCPGLRAPAGAS